MRVRSALVVAGEPKSVASLYRKAVLTSNPGPVRRWSRGDRRFERAFLRELVKQASGASPQQVIVGANALFERERGTLSDAPSQTHLLLACYVLAAYRHLIDAGGAPDEARRVVTRALVSPNQRTARLFMAACLLLPGDRLAFLRRSTEWLVRSVYGDWFRFRSEGDGTTRFVSIVEQCGFFDLLSRHGEPDLTQAFCAWDTTWSGAISATRHGVRFELDGTIAQGRDACRFCFVRTDARGRDIDPRGQPSK